MAQKIKLSQKATGERALLLHVLATAVNDLADGDPDLRADAAEYFTGPVFRDHKDWLDLPADWMPAGVGELVNVQ